MQSYTYLDLAKMIDHSLVNPTLTTTDLEAGCRLARLYDTASVSIMPYATTLATVLLAGSSVKCGATVGFPHGSHATVIKEQEAARAIADGAQELDMVVNISKVLSGDWQYVTDDLRAVVDRAHARDVKVKVIFENCFLKDDHKIRLCEIASIVGVDWIKTSTGYASGGATLEDLTLMRKHAAPHVGVKAAGGVRDLDALLQVRALGVTRCGATRTASMLDEARRRLGLEPLQSQHQQNIAGAPVGY